MPPRDWFLWFAAVAAFLAWPTMASAQRGGASGGVSSGFGASSFGGAAGSSFGRSSGGSSFGASGFGGGLGGSSFGGGLGGSAFGGSSFGGAGAGAGFGAGLGGAFGQPGAFVGRSAADLDAFFSGANRRAQATAGESRSGRSRGDRGGSGDSDQRRPPVAVSLRPAPDLARAVARDATAPLRATRNAAAAIGRKGLRGVTVAVADGVATLEGTVATDDERLVAEKLLMLEPGVRTVENRLAVAEPVPAPTSP